MLLSRPGLLESNALERELLLVLCLVGKMIAWLSDHLRSRQDEFERSLQQNWLMMLLDPTVVVDPVEADQRVSSVAVVMAKE